MDSSSASSTTSSRPTHIPLPPPPSFSAFLSTPSPSQRDDPFAEEVQSPYLQFYTAPSTPYSEADPSQPPSPSAADYFTPPTSPFVEIPVPEPAPTQEVEVSSKSPSPPPPIVPQAISQFGNTYVTPDPDSTDDIYPGIPVDVVNDLILDDGSLTALEKIYLFCRSKQVKHRSFIVKNMPKLIQEVPPQEAVEYVLPLFRELVLDPDENVQEEFSRSLGDVMWWFVTHCQVVANYSEEADDHSVSPARIHYQTFTPLFGSLILNSNGNISETARCSITTVLERIKAANDKDALIRGQTIRPPLPPENLWEAPAQDYAMDDPEIEEEEPAIGLFGPEERTLVKHEILAALVIALGRLDTLWEDGLQPDEIVAASGQNVDERRSWLEAQNGDGVQVVSPGELGNDEDGVTPSADLEASESDVIIKEDTVNPYFPIVPSSFSVPSSTSSSPSTGNSSNSSFGSSPKVPAVHGSSRDTSPAEFSPVSDPPDVLSHSDSSSSRASQGTLRTTETEFSPANQAASAEIPQVPEFLHPRKLRRPKSLLAYQISLGNIIREEQEDVYYDEQATNGRWSAMRLIATVAANGTSDPETEIHFIGDVGRSVNDPVYWVRREAAFAIGALARVVPVEFVVKDLAPMFQRLVADPHVDVRQNVLFSLPPLVQRLPFGQRRALAFETLTALSQDPEKCVRQSALDTLSETIYAFSDDPQGPPEFLLHMYLGRKEDNNVRNGTPLITFEEFPPLESFYLDTKRPLTLAFGFPAVTLTLGKDRWDELKEAYLDLSANRMPNVKLSLAAGLGEIAKVIGHDNARRDLVQVWWNSISCKDEPVRIRAVESLETFIGVVGQDLGLSFLEAIQKNWEAGIFKGWRERKIILQELIKMPALLGDEVLSVVKAVQVRALLDAEQGVRDIAVETLPKIFGLLSPYQHLLDDLNNAIAQLLSSTFRRRMTFAACQRSKFLASVASGQKPSAALANTLLREMSNLSKDTVTDVRISVARFVGSVCDHFIRESEPVPEHLAEIVGLLSQDSSLSVRSFIPDLTTLLGGQQPVTFPFSNEVVERTPVTPMRSRHFSKPPLPRRQTSSAAILSAADITSADSHHSEANANGEGAVADRGYEGQDNQSDDHNATASQIGQSWSGMANAMSDRSGESWLTTPRAGSPMVTLSSDAMDTDT